MGCGYSSVSEKSEKTEPSQQTKPPATEKAIPEMPSEFTKKEFQALRNSNTMEDALHNLTQIGTNLKDQSPTSITPTGKICFICCNTYTKEQYKLGVGPLNDSVTVALNHQERGYKVFFQHNPTPAEFRQFLPVFLKSATDHLTVFFTGHGANIRDRDGDESDGLDEAMVFDTGHIVDDELVKILNENSNGKTRILLLTDCCHSGSIWDLQSAEKRGNKLPPNILSISAAKDTQTAKQTKMDNKDQGIFSYFFWRCLNQSPKESAESLEKKMNEQLNRFKQHFTAYASSPNMMTEPIFP